MDKNLQKLDPDIKVCLSVSNEVRHGSNFCVCHLYTVINFNISRVGFVWEINESIYSNSVEFKLIYSVLDTLIQRK